MLSSYTFLGHFDIYVGHDFSFPTLILATSFAHLLQQAIRLRESLIGLTGMKSIAVAGDSNFVLRGITPTHLEDHLLAFQFFS